MELIDYFNEIRMADTLVGTEMLQLWTWFSALARRERPQSDTVWINVPDISFTYAFISECKTRVYVHDRSEPGKEYVRFFDVYGGDLDNIVSLF